MSCSAWAFPALRKPNPGRLVKQPPAPNPAGHRIHRKFPATDGLPRSSHRVNIERTEGCRGSSPMALRIAKDPLRAAWDFFVLFSGISTASNLSRTQRQPVRRRGLFLYRPPAPAKPNDPPGPSETPTGPPIGPSSQPEFSGPARALDLDLRLRLCPGSGLAHFQISAGDTDSPTSVLRRQSGDIVEAASFAWAVTFQPEIRIPIAPPPRSPQIPNPAPSSWRGESEAAAAQRVPRVPKVLVELET